MAILKFKDENNQWQDLPAIRGRDGVRQYTAGSNITIENDVISAIQQDLSDYYTKAQVNGLINAIETVQLEPVAELPATGEPNVIYLVPSSNPQTANAKDEYIYINDAWEQIGTTAVDLSNYLAKDNTTSFTPSGDYNPATKKYVDDALNTVVGEKQLVFAKVFEYNNDTKTQINALFNSTTSDATICGYFSEILTKAFKYSSSVPDLSRANLTLMLSFVGGDYPGDTSKNISMTLYFYGDSTLFRGIGKVGNSGVIKLYTLNFTAKSQDVQNKIVTVSGAYLRSSEVVCDIPTTDYGLANKKYVDDSIAGAGGVTQADLLKRGIYVRCDSQLNTTSTTSLSNAAIAELQAGLQAAYDAGLSTVDITLAFKTNNSNTLGYMSYQVYHLRQHSGIHIIGKPTDLHYLDFNANTTTFADAAPVRKFQLVISATWSGNTITVTRAEYRLVQNTIMYLDNTYTYTPTQNYHPATKKYVDDSIAAIPIPTATEQRVIYIDISSTYTSILSGDRTYQNITIPTEALAELNALDDISNALIIIHTAYDHVLLNPQSKNTLIDSSVTPNVYGNTYVGTAIRYGSVVPSTPTYTQCCLVIKYTNNPFTLTGTCDFRSRPQEIALKSELHTHTNKTTLDTITAQDITDWNSAVTDSHTHTNKTVLDGISSSDITNWNKVHIYSGTSAPGAGTGENGDIYVKYTA